VSRSAGFTLVELLVAMAILATVFALAGASWTALGRAEDRARHAAIDVEDRAASLAWLRARLETAMPMSFQDAGRRDLAFVGEPDQLIFVSAPADYEGGATLQVWSLSVDRDLPTRLQVARQPLPPDAELLPDFDRIDSSEILQVKGALAFGYLEDVEGVQRWVERWTNINRLPLAIRLRSDRPGELHLVVPLYQHLPPLCASALGAERLECGTS